MPTKTYYSVAGEIIAEETGGVRTDYITDALGSIVGTVDSSQAVVNTYRFKPYGALLAKTGTGPDPSFLWTGNTGSRTTNLNRAEQYNRARHLGVKEACWTTLDPVWPDRSAYGYVAGRPTQMRDPSGLQPCEYGQIFPTNIPTPQTAPTCLDVLMSGKHVYGFTACDVHTGNAYSRICTFDGCLCEKVKTHESRHRKDIGVCCARINTCEMYCKMTPAGLREDCDRKDCINAYVSWASTKEFSRWTECNAYAESINWLQDKIHWYNKRGLQDQCLVQLKNCLAFERGLRAGLMCSGAAKPRCPLQPDGSIRP